MKAYARFFFLVSLALALAVSALGITPATPVRAATLTVNSTADNTTAGDGFCTLREAIQTASNYGNGDCGTDSTADDTISFIVSGTITLTSSLPSMTSGTGALTIDGTGQTITISGDNLYRIMTVPSGANLTLQNLTIANGYMSTNGGGIYNSGTLTITASVFTGNTADSGGGVYNLGTLIITNSTFSNNNANVANGYGGGVYNTINGTLTIMNSTFSNNSASGTYGYGGGVYNVGNGTLTITDSTFQNNSARYGGSVFNNATLNITNSTFSNNSASSDDGGAIYNAGSMTVTGSTFSANQALNGGGGAINDATSGTSSITGSTFFDNQAKFGGALYLAQVTMTVSESTFESNDATNDAGAIYVAGSASLTMTNSTVSANTAGGRGGGIFAFNPVTLTNVTISDNSGTTGAGGVHMFDALTLTNTIIANSTSGGDCVLASGGSVSGTSSNNLIEDSTNACGLTNGSNGNIVGSDPILGPLQNNGGSTETHALLPGSPAINAGTNIGCPATDQIGTTRPQGGTCDIGAYEVPPDTTAPTVSSIVRQLPTDQVVTSGSSVTFRVTFSEDVTGVDAADFTLTLLSVPGTNASISGVTSVSASVYDVTVDISGLRNSKNKLDGAIRLDVSASASITDLASNALSGLPFTGGQVYSIVQEQSFSDVATSHWAWTYIERLFYMGITGGCTTSNYCPNNVVTRAQMAIFLLRGIHGASYTPPPASGTVFADVTTSTPGADWIEQLYAEGITSGCGGGNYCPSSSVTRAQMAIFLLRAKHGASYTPPPATGTVFSDVSTSTPGAAWIEQLYAEGITSGCGGGKYCPSAVVTRAEMAVFLVRTFNLP